MCRGTRVHVELLLKNLCESQNGVGGFLRQEFLKLRDHADEEDHTPLQEWMFKPCVSHLRGLNPQEHISLQSYYHPETLVFTLAEVDGQLQATPRPDDRTVARLLTPRVSIDEPSVVSAIEHGILIFPASTFEIVRADDCSEWELDDLPRFVKTPKILGQFKFNEASSKESFTRELDTLLQIRHHDPKRELRVSRLVGLVEWEDEPSVAGLLVQHPLDEKTLDWAMKDASKTDRARWAQQIRQTVERLHQLDIVWGSARPENVLIDVEGEAWVTDFSGGWSSSWVEKELEGTKEGDLKGLARIEEFL